MINITYEQAQEMYEHLLDESIHNLLNERSFSNANIDHCHNLPRGNVQARVTGIISVAEHRVI